MRRVADLHPHQLTIGLGNGDDECSHVPAEALGDPDRGIEKAAAALCRKPAKWLLTSQANGFDFPACDEHCDAVLALWPEGYAKVVPYSG